MSKPLPERLRDAARKLRTSRMPLSDYIPLLQQAADYIEAQGMPDVDSLTDAIAEGLRGTYHCTRAWEAWHVGTMDQDDFGPVDESDTPRDLAETVIAMLAAAPPAPQPHPERQSLQAEGKHPAPCARFCGANAFKIEIRGLEAQLKALAQPQPVQQEPIAYLDIGAGGYLDLATDLTDEQLLALPKGRHTLVIAGTFGIDGYTSPQAAQPQPLSDGQINQMWSDAHNDTSPMSLIHVLARAIEAAHGIKE